ncbi:MAG TPA: glycosyltransferase family 2 protein [Rhizomicrobium sp.]|jgi:hypothetical protein|nr:glycosyltransferase family 2 protein [Rhizomicrobium sp.]
MPPNRRVTEVAFTKNEGRFLLEWIAYHRAIGVGDFLIYTNDCEDESPALLERLAEMGIVVHVPNPLLPGEQAQNKALNHARDHPLVTAADYVLQIDPDEFLCIKAGAGRIEDLIATASGADVVAVQMRFFGDSGLPRLDDGLVIAQLTQASAEDFETNTIVKSLARVGGPFFKITANHMPGFEPRDGQHPRIFNAGGMEIPPQAYGGERFRNIPAAWRSMQHAQLNHYAVRTFADYRAKKYRGTAANNDRKLTLDYWNARNRNEVRDTSIARHIPATKALMEEWLRDPELARRNRRCFEAYEEILKKSEGFFADEA